MTILLTIMGSLMVTNTSTNLSYTMILDIVKISGYRTIIQLWITT